MHTIPGHDANANSSSSAAEVLLAVAKLAAHDARAPVDSQPGVFGAGILPDVLVPLFDRLV